ncbi:MAG: twin-arginine translocation signal domain-containing protein [Planctomycetota bacterium]|nr:MAG: twin-arginine translocation signal domain-containing protein [Planctomycetota bacterium]
MSSFPFPKGSRRRFLKLSAGTTAGVMLASSIPAVHAAEDNTIRLGIVGCGGRGTGAVGNALSTEGGPVKLYAMGDLFEDRLEGSRSRLEQQFGDKIDVPPERRFLGFDAYKKVIDSLRPGDVVILTTHSAFRPLHFEYAVERGVNVFMEKSFAVDAPANHRLEAAADKSVEKGLKVGVGFMWRHSKARQEVINRIHDGAIGDVHTLRIYRMHGPVFCPKRPADMNQIEFQLRNGARFNWVCSGFFIDWHCHNIDVACWAKGDWPVEAHGLAGRTDDRAGNLLDHYAVEYTFADGAKLYCYSRHMVGCWSTYSDYAHGTKGAAVLMTNLSQPKTRIYNNLRMTDDALVWRYEEREPNPYVVEWQELLDAIRQDKPHNESQRAAKANMVALMGRMAAHTGQFVTIEQAEQSTFQYVADIDHLTFDSEPPIVEGPDGIYPCPVPGVSKEI